MADDIDNDGGTQDGQPEGSGDIKPEGKLYTEDQINALVQAGQKEAVTKTWGDMQSKADKAIQVAKTETTTALQQLTDLKRANIEALPPEQKQAAMLEDVYQRMNSAPDAKPQDGVTDSQSQTQGDAPTFQQTPTVPSDAQVKAQEAAGKILQEKGLDPSKINYGDGKDGDADFSAFVDSVLAQVRSSSEQDDSARNKTTYDNSRGAGGAVDILTVDPVELMKRGYRNGNWRRRGGDI